MLVFVCGAFETVKDNKAIGYEGCEVENEEVVSFSMNTKRESIIAVSVRQQIEEEMGVTFISCSFCMTVFL